MNALGIELNLIDSILSGLKPIGTISSPSSITEFTMDIHAESISDPLLGKLVVFRHNEGDKRKIVIAQVKSIESINKLIEDPGVKTMIQAYGPLPHISGKDTKVAYLSLVSVYEETINSDGELVLRESTLNTPPSTDSIVYEATQELIELIPLESKFYLGTIYGGDLPVPFVLKHYGSPPGGWGEGFSYGIFGKSGSGKSVLAAMLIIGLARHPSMGILIFDTQGEFSRNAFKDRLGLDFHEIIQRLKNGGLHVYSLDEIALESTRSLVKLLDKVGFFEDFGILQYGKKSMLISDLMIALSSKSPSKLTFMDIHQFVNNWIRKKYSKWDVVRDRMEPRIAKDKWDLVMELFDASKRVSVERIVNMFESGEVVILNLSNFPKSIETLIQMPREEIRAIIMKEVIDKVILRAEKEYRAGKLTNGLLVIEEAHNYVPSYFRTSREESVERRELLSLIKDRVKETRKYGIGWMFITQSTVDFNKEIYRQLHNYIFMHGLSIGADVDNVKSALGSDLFDLYKTFKDPKRTGKYQFIVIGPIVGLSSTGMAMAVECFTDMSEFLEINGLL